MSGREYDGVLSQYSTQNEGGMSHLFERFNQQHISGSVEVLLLLPFSILSGERIPTVNPVHMQSVRVRVYFH